MADRLTRAAEEIRGSAQRPSLWAGVPGSEARRVTGATAYGRASRRCGAAAGAALARAAGVGVPGQWEKRF